MCFFPKVNCFCVYRKLVTWATNAKGLSLPCTYSSPYSTHCSLKDWTLRDELAHRISGQFSEQFI